MLSVRLAKFLVNLLGFSHLPSFPIEYYAAKLEKVRNQPSLASSPSSSPPAMDIDSNTALDLVNKGASLLLLDVPQFTLLGIDTQVSLSLSRTRQMLSLSHYH